jgi:hypothetical protein
VLVLGSGIGAVAVTRIMSGRGQGVGLSVVYLAGAGQVVAAVAWGSWPLLLAGCGLLGGGNAAVLLARYAAADLSSRRGRSISAVVAPAPVGAGARRNQLGPAGVHAGVVGLPAPTGLFLLAIPAFLAATLVLVSAYRSMCGAGYEPTCKAACCPGYSWWCSCGLTRCSGQGRGAVHRPACRHRWLG